MVKKHTNKTDKIDAFHAITKYLRSDFSQKKSFSTSNWGYVLLYSGGTERSVLLCEGSAALTVVKRDEREGVWAAALWPDN